MLTTNKPKMCSHATRSLHLVHVRTSWEGKKNVKKEQITGWLFLLRSICRPIVRAYSFFLLLSLCLFLLSLSIFSFFHSLCSFANYYKEQLFKLKEEEKNRGGKRGKKKRTKNERVCACTSVLDIIHALSMLYE